MLRNKSYLANTTVAMGISVLTLNALTAHAQGDDGKAFAVKAAAKEGKDEEAEKRPAKAAKEAKDEEAAKRPAKAVPADEQGKSEEARQRPPTPVKANEPTNVLDTMVVTGSRLKTTTFNSPSSIQVITAEDMRLLGQTSIASVLQNSTAAANAKQIDGNYGAYTVEGGGGINTVSLRGAGALRTLVLVNGHRVGPAGVQGRVGPVDLNTIPSSLIERAEILKDGASSLYGSDALAGVINLITKKNYQGGTVSITESLPVHGGGRSDNISLSQSIVRDRWYGSLGLDYSNQEALNLGDRDWSRCQNPYVYYDDGTRADLIDPKTGTYRCNTLGTGYMSVGSAVYVPDASATVGGGITGKDLDGLHRVRYSFPTSDSDYVNKQRQTRAEVPAYSPRFANTNMISPSRKLSLSVSGGYKLKDELEIYTDLLLNQRKSGNTQWVDLFPTVDKTNPNNISVAGNTLGLTPANAYSVVAIPQITRQQVDYTRGMIGIKGSLPDVGSLKNWDWDLAAQFSHSSGTYGTSFVYSDRVAATTAAGTVCDTSKLISATSCPTGGVQWFRPSTVTDGVFSNEEAAFLFGYEDGRTTYDQKYIEANFHGDLFPLPAGMLQGAFGLQLRKESLNDQPGAQAKAKNYWNTSTVGATKGDDTITELYGELSVPLVRNAFLAKSLEVDLSSRLSRYETYGSSTTYKLGQNWALSDAFRIRGTQGTSFRAPGLYEHFLAGTESYWQQSIDPCYQLLQGSLSAPSANLVANCAKVALPSDYTGGSSAAVVSGGNGSTLKAETALNRTIGAIWTPSFMPLMVSVDYYDMRIRNQIAAYGPANILSRCLNSENMSSPFCSLFNRATSTTGSYVAGNITYVDDSYQNVAEQRQRGVDLSFSVDQKMFGGTFTFSSDNTWVRKWTYQLVSNVAPSNLLGRIGYPKYNGKLNFRYQRGDYTVNWGVDMVGPASNYSDLGGDTTANYSSTGVTVHNIVSVPFYSNHSLTFSKKMDKLTTTISVRNLFDRDPPIISAGTDGRVGNAALTSQYDQMGRTIVVGLQKSW
ncbi:TonB-dependent receptor [Roseateles sp. SL47]|uniref:TonB-dependent receptor domain-containing protein n=1 Tax=Roseateles sp. SL47 TaxID=2995138 RepID=UPI00226D9E35|nr:TonB-dependent receptor [Roseateles sp. SL47]WAC75708.1 TonB-dependent receptor [Roseateles sp. SL47]